MKSMKKYFSTTVAAIMSTAMMFSLVGCDSSSDESASKEEGKKYVLHAAYSVADSETSQHTIKMREIKRIVEEKTNGNVQIVLHPGGELGGEKEYVEMLQNGEIAMASISTSFLSGFSKALSLFDTPFLFRDQAQVSKFITTGQADGKMAELEKIGLEILGLNPVGARNFLTVPESPINELSDLEGKKIRTMSAEVQVKAIETLGAQPMPLAYSETYQSMQTGVIDGMENEVDTYLAMKFYEVAPNYTEVGWLQLVHATVASKEVMDSLPEEYQTIIKEAADVASRLAEQKGLEYKENVAEQALKEANVNLIKIDNSEFRQKLIDEQFYEGYADVIGQEVTDWIKAN